MGVFFTAVGKYTNVILMLIVNAILSRILTPSDYGVVSVITVFIVFFQLFVDAGFGPAIVQNPDITEDDLSSLFNFSIVFGLIGSIIFSLFGNFIAKIYDNSIYINLFNLLSISITLFGMNIVPIAILTKGKKFKTISFIQVFGNLIGGIVAIILAYSDFGVYSLIIMNIITPLINFIFFFKKSGIIFKWHLDLKSVKKIWYFAKNQLLFNFINYFSRNADNLLIGRYLGDVALGNYSKAYQLLMYPNTILLGVIAPVLQPVLRTYQNNVSKIRDAYMDVVHILAMIGLPLSVFLSFSSREIIFVMFGRQWSDAIIPFAILSTTVWIQMTLSSSGAIFQSRNKPQYLLLNGIISALIIVPSIILGLLTKSINGVSAVLSLGFYINFFVSFHLVMRNALDSNLLLLIKELKNPLIVAIIQIVVLYITNYMIFIENAFLSLITKGFIFTFVFFVINYALGEIDFVKKLLSRSK